MSFTAQITADIGGFEASLNKAGERLKQFQKDVDDGIAGISHIGKSIEGIGKKLSVVSAAFVVAGGAAFKMAADLEDAIGATDQIFKDVSQNVKGWADGLKSDYGVAKKEALEYSNLMGTMLKEIGGLTRDEAAKQASALVELAGDLTAMFGGNVSEAVTALTGSLRGVNVMLGRYGVAVNDVLIKTRAFEMGILSAGQEMTPAIKQAATLSLIYEQTGAAQGQAAREAKSASGAMRSLRVEIANLSTEIGEKLLPVITPIVVKIREIVSVIRNMSPEMLSLSVAIAGIAAASGPILLIIGKVVQMLPAIKVGLTSIKTAMIALTGPVGAITLALVALTAGLVYFTNRAKEAKTVSGALANVNEIVTKSISREVTQLNYLLKIARDETKSKEERGKAIEKINKISPDYLGFLELETINTNEAKKAIDKYTESLKENARQKAVADEITRLFAKRAKHEIDIVKNMQRMQGAGAEIQRIAQNSINSNEKAIESIDKQIALYESLGGAVKEVTEAGGDAADSLATQGKTLEAATGKSKAFNDTVKELFKDGSDVYAVVRQVSDRITVLTQRLEGLRNGTIIVKNVGAEIARVEKELSELNPALKQLTGDRDLNINLKISGGSETWDSVVKKVTKPIVIPPINTSLIEGSMGKFEQTLNKVSETARVFNDSVTQSISDGMQSIIEGIISVEGLNVDSVVSAILAPLGNMAIQLGEIAIATGIGLQAIQEAFKSMNPYLAVAAGIALIALGATIKGAVSNVGKSVSGGGGYSGGTSSYSNVTSPGLSEYRGRWDDDFNVEFVIKGESLVGVLNTAQQRRNRT